MDLQQSVAHPQHRCFLNDSGHRRKDFNRHALARNSHAVRNTSGLSIQENLGHHVGRPVATLWQINNNEE
jgi:hypothetical protein